MGLNGLATLFDVGDGSPGQPHRTRQSFLRVVRSLPRFFNFDTERFVKGPSWSCHSVVLYQGSHRCQCRKQFLAETIY
jgi:hypothetical protein